MNCFVVCVWTVHRRSKATKSHKIENDLSGIKRSSHPTHSIHYCDIHGDSRVEFYCPGHDNVFCRLCQKFDHRNCQSVQNISDVCSGSSHQYQQYLSEIDALVKEFKNLKSQRDSDIKYVITQGKLCRDDVKKLRIEVNNMFDKLEQKMDDGISDIGGQRKG